MVLGACAVSAHAQRSPSSSIYSVEGDGCHWDCSGRSPVAIWLAGFSFQRRKLVCPQPGVDMDRVRDILLYFVAALAMFALLCAVYQAMQNQNWSATVLGALFVACVMIVYINQLELLKVFGVEAKLRKVDDTLTEAQVIAGRLTELSKINARVSYMLMGWGNRMDGPSAKDKQAIIDDVDKQLVELKISPQERASISKSYVQLIGVDLYYICIQVMERYAAVKNREIMGTYDKDRSDANRVAAQNFTAAQGKWMAAKSAGPFSNIDGYVFEDVINRATPVDWLNTQEQAIAKGFANQLTAMFKACEAKGGYTPEAAEFIDKYRGMGGIDAKMKELFGVSYN
jgi:hypothetical protein